MISDQRGEKMKLKQEKALKEYNSLWREIEMLWHEIAWKAGVSDSAFAILSTILELGEGCLQRDICDMNYISKQTIHSSVQKLMRDGFLSLEAGRGRDMHIFLTPAGKAMLDEKIAPAIQIENLAFTDMTEEEQTEFLRLNRKYADNLRKYTTQL